MYYSYKRRSSGNSVWIFLVLSAVVILFISPRARRTVGGWFGTLSTLLMGVGREVGRKVNQVGMNITDKFRTYKLSDLAGGFMRTYTASKGNKVTSNEEEEEEKIYFHDLTSRENQTDEEDEYHEEDYDQDDTKKY